MALGRSGRDKETADGSVAYPGEPAIGVDLAPPFTAADESTRWLFSLNRMGIRPGLVRIQGLLNDLGNPQDGLRILVTAGTNGKGSTTRVLDRLLRAAGHSTATYTSPHLLNVYERIRLDDVPVEASDFAARIEAIRPLVEKHEASWFETLTALAVTIAHDAGVDFLCCETGLGGRLDATNALPALAILLTTVSHDHQRILGESRQEILAEKLGLLKTGVPLFCGIDEDLRGQVFRTAVSCQSPCYFLDELARLGAVGPAAAQWQLTLREDHWTDLPDPGTEALRRNVALAVLTLRELERSGGLPDLLPDDLAGALRDLFLPGRFQHVLATPDWIFDTAHNPQALNCALGAFADRPVTGRRIVLFGAMHDKDLDSELGSLLARCDLVLGAPVALPRSRSITELQELFVGWGLAARIVDGDDESADTGCLVLRDLAEALAWLATHCTPADSVLVTGSCFTVAEVFYQLGFRDLDQTRVVQPAAAVLHRAKERM